MKDMIRAENLRKEYCTGNQTCVAVKDISIQVKPATAIAIIGRFRMREIYTVADAWRAYEADAGKNLDLWGGRGTAE